MYDAVSDVVESGVQWRFNFQIGSRLLKTCYKPILMHISMAYNVISCIVVAEITQTLKIDDFLDGYALEEIQISTAETRILSCCTKLCL